MTVVVDLGCADRGQWFSLQALAEKYRPEIIYGFDPSPQLDTSVNDVNGTPVKLVRKAAWLFNGRVPFTDEQTSGRMGTIEFGEITVPCFDFSRWLKRHGPAVVKMDIESSEYKLLPKLIEDGTDKLIEELIIEWHYHPDEWVLSRLTCPVTAWWM